jgi:DNA invertase Pin-like site-specific DNA recombinase
MRELTAVAESAAHGRLKLTVLGGLAEFEFELIRARTTEGRKRAVARGLKAGRKPKLTPHQVNEGPRPPDAVLNKRLFSEQFDYSATLQPASNRLYYWVSDR